MLINLATFFATLVLSSPAAFHPVLAPVKAPAPLYTPAAPAAPAPAPMPEPLSVTAGLVLSTPIVLSPVRVATAPTAGELLASVQKFYAGVKQVTAKFRQEVTNAAFNDTKTSDGMVWIAKPGKMRWDYYGKKQHGKVSVKKSFISNGSYLYVVEHDNKQVFKKNLQNDLMPVAISFLYGKGDLAAEFDPAIDSSGTYGAKTDIVLKLTPKKQSAQYKLLYLVIDPTGYRVKESIIIDSSSNVNHFRFYEPDFEKALTDDRFQFNEKSVKNYRIRDADAEQAQPGAKAE
jgi:outer membrane lipoprotein-sorting protein